MRDTGKATSYPNIRMKSIAPMLPPAVMDRVTVNEWLIFGLFLACVGVATIPIFSDRYLSINDYPNHLARGAVLLNYIAIRLQIATPVFRPYVLTMPRRSSSYFF
jgi:hypothetical protein